MKYIDESSYRFFEELKELSDKHESLQEEWEKAAEQAIKDGNDIESTRPLFDEAKKAHNEWQDFLYKHAEILLVGKK